MKLIITAGAIILDKINKEILLVRRPSDKRLFPGYWSFPGGKLEEGETLEDCVIREVEEETGLSFKPEEKYNFTEYVFENTHNISHLYVGSYTGDMLVESSVGWFSYAELERIEIAFNYKEVIDYFRHKGIL